MTDWSRRDVLSAVAAGLAAAELPRAAGAAVKAPSAPPQQAMRIRTITAGVAVSGPGDVAALERALKRLLRVRQRAQDAGFEVQTIRVATTPFVANLDAAQRRLAIDAVEKFDAAIAAEKALLSIGPVLSGDRFDPDLGPWAAELVRRTQRTSFSVSVASADGGVHRSAIHSAARVIDELSRVDNSGSANCRFAAAASVPPGTPFFPVAYHQGPDSLAFGLESAGVLQTAFEGASDPPPLSWKACHPSTVHRFKAQLTCPKGHGLVLKGHSIDARGRVYPSVVCMTDSCEFHEFVRLVGWDFGPLA